MFFNKVVLRVCGMWRASEAAVRAVRFATQVHDRADDDGRNFQWRGKPFGNSPTTTTAIATYMWNRNSD